ncbi:beta-glucosidase [Phycicoccus flavus]|uniref:Exo-alpha-(1->6)-L-arabinopyranosidase n=1 Tax=Phycicoccus flavus TaxID=2502783 RepID=A0A8T6QYU9_9MICO|nr:glycoside hydrolase family 3 N-terminal domain-containing protein [Phycicoccus flavus]NHA66472.1 glycosyl hydrolase [Phycicoccus flavus]
MSSASPAVDPSTSATDLPVWRDPSRSVDERTDALLAAMTLREKVAQLGSRWVGNDMSADPEQEAGGDEDAGETFVVAPMQDVFAAAGSVSLEEASRDGLGQLTRVFGSYPLTVAEGVAEVVRQHHVVLRDSRLGVPALVHEECLTGFTTFGATVYPAAIAWAATFDPDLVEEMAAAIGRDMAAVGVHQGLSPVLDVVRDPRWGRVEETMGEDPYVVATLGSAYVRGLQSAGVVATLKHFAGYSASRAARNHGPVSMGRRELVDVILPPFETAVREAGVKSVMNSYSDVDGVPAGADPWLLTEVLREEWGFEGTVVSDYWAVPFLASMHRVAGDVDAAGVAALTAGIDVELPDTSGFGAHLADLVEAGALDEALVDRAARRHLRHKVELGLLDPDWTPEGSVAGSGDLDLDSPGNRDIAARMAERSVVLLDPGSALPLAGPGRTAPARVAVLGPCADDPRTHMGCYAFPNHVLPRYPGRGLGLEVTTMVDALRAELPDTEIAYERGCAVEGEDASGIGAAAEAAAGADLAVVFVGDRAGLFGIGTSGEGCDAEDLRLPGVQPALLDAVVATGTPTVVVVVSGRPYALGAWADRAAGLVQAFMPGEEGGPAVAGVLSGRVQPSGHLPVQIPYGPGGQPRTYLQPPLGSPDSSGVSSLDASALFPFGHGRSYTTFEVADLTLSADEVGSDGAVEVSVRVTNTGDRAGEEVVQLYGRDVVSSVVVPVRRLLGFTRVPLEPGASATVTFDLHTDRLALVGRDLERVVEPGLFELTAGSSAGDTPCRAALEVTGEPRVLGGERRLTVPVRLTREPARP